MSGMDERKDMDRKGFLSLAGDIGRGLLELAWPTRCVCCDVPGELVCDACLGSLPYISQRDACPLCGAPYGAIACTECWTGEGMVEHPFSAAACAMEFAEGAARMTVAYKDWGERRLADVIARMIRDAVAEAWGGCGAQAVVPIPATRGALHRRGFDHMAPVAHELARLLGTHALEILDKADSADQRDLGRDGRRQNMADVFSIAEDARSVPQSVLLVDDVFTTGATLSAASGVLLAAGAEEVRVATLCRVW